MKNYIALCESLISTLSPGHPLPVLASHLTLSHLPPSPSPGSSTPAFITSSEARHASTERSDRLQITSLLRRCEAAERRGDEATRQLGAARGIAERKTREATTAGRNVKKLAEENRRLAAEVAGSAAPRPKAALKSAPRPALPSSRPLPPPSRVSELTSTISSLKSQLSASSSALSSSELQVKVLSDALEIKAADMGLPGPQVLSDLSAARGEAVALKASATAASDKLLVLQSNHDALLEELALAKSKASAAASSEESMKAQFHLLGGDTLRELTEEKDALLDYVADSLDSVARLEEESKGLQEEVAELRDHREQNATLQEEVISAAAKIESLNEQLSSSASAATSQKDTVEDQREEMEEMARMQIDLLEQVRASEDEKLKMSDSLNEAKSQLEAEAVRHETSRSNLETTNAALNHANAELSAAQQKLSQIVPKVDSADAELRVLRSRLRDLEDAEGKAARAEAELRDLKPVKAALDKVAGDIRGTTYESVRAAALSKNPGSSDVEAALDISASIASGRAAATTKAQWHAAWVNTGSLTALLPSLGDRVQSLFTDVSMMESQLGDLSAVLAEERKDRDVERRVLSDSLVSKEQQVKDLSENTKSLTDKVTELQAQNDRAKSAEAAAAQLRTLWLSHCQEEGAELAPSSSVADLEVVHSVARALYAGRQASARANQSLQRLVESEAMVNMREQEVHKLQATGDDLVKQLTNTRAGSEADIAGLRSEGTALAAELESAAELAEKQGALALTLEGRLEALQAERAMLSTQFHACQEELEGVNAELSRALLVANERSRGSLTDPADGQAGLRLGGNSPTGVVVKTAADALSMLADKVGAVTQQLIAAQARAEMAEVTSLARTNVGAGMGTPAGSVAGTPLAASRMSAGVTPLMRGSGGAAAAADDGTNELLNRQKQQLGEMQQKWGLSSVETPGAGGGGGSALFNRHREQQQRIESVTKSAMSVRSAAAAGLSTPLAAGTGAGAGASTGARARAPSPGTQALQERLKKAQAAFKTLSRN